MLFTQLSLLLTMKISNGGKHEWALHGRNNLEVSNILVIGHWHKNLAQDVKAWRFTNTSSIFDLPHAKGVQQKEPDPVCRHFPHPSYVLWKTPVTG